MKHRLNMNLRAVRLKAGLTQEDLAFQLNISTMSVGRWEKGSIPTAFQRARLCQFFARSERELGWSELEQPPFHSSHRIILDPCIPTSLPFFDQPLNDLSYSLTSDSQQRILGLIGLPGSGKSTMAAALANSVQCQETFSGILWATLGQNPKHRRHLLRWATLLGIEQLPEDLDEARDVLRVAIGKQRFLIVLDDLWKEEDVPFYQISNESSYLLTTRLRSLAYQLCDVICQPHILTYAQAERNLLSALPHLFAELRPALQGIIRTCSGLPLALKIAGTALRYEASTGSLRRVRETIAEYSLSPFGREPEHHLLYRAIQRSEQYLASSARRALLSLSQLPEAFSERLAAGVLRNANLHLRDLDSLVDAGLADFNRNSYHLHSVIAAYTRFVAIKEGLFSQGKGVSPTFYRKRRLYG